MRYLMTYSLLNAWRYCLKSGELDEFIKTLNREPIETNEAMRLGNEFEAWAAENIPELQGAVRQAAVYKDVRIGGTAFLLYGKTDFIKAGVITDTKYTGHYDVGKFYGSPQHAMYFALIPEAIRFDYIVTTEKGDYSTERLYRESYYPAETPPIEGEISSFMGWLRANDLLKIYQEKWEAK